MNGKGVQNAQMQGPPKDGRPRPETDWYTAIVGDTRYDGLTRG